MPETMTKPAQDVYGQMKEARKPYLDRARRAAEVTVPYLLATYEATPGEDLEQPSTSFGSRAVNSLVNKLLLSLFPVQIPFFRLFPEDDIAEIIGQTAGPEELSEIAVELNKVSDKVLRDMAVSATRTKMHDSLMHTVVAGNALVNVDKDSERVFHLPSYVVERTPRGKIRLIIVRELKRRALLSETEMALLEKGANAAPSEETPQPMGSQEREFVELWTVVEWDGKRWQEWQELGKEKVPDSEASYAKDELPWLALRMIAVDGEHYGRSYVELYEADLISLNGLARAVVEGAAIASKMNPLLDPNGHLKAKDLTEAENGQPLEGRPDEVTYIQVPKLPELSFAQAMGGDIEQRLSFAFLMTTSVQRDAERVTAEEIRLLAGELSENLGGVYSLLTTDLQIPMVRLLVNRQPTDERAAIIKDARIAITAGLDAIGKGRDFEAHRQWILTLQEAGLDTREIINGIEYARLTGAFLGIDSDAILRTEEEIQSQRTAAAIAAGAQRAAPQIAEQVLQQQQAG